MAQFDVFLAILPSGCKITTHQLYRYQQIQPVHIIFWYSAEIVPTSLLFAPKHRTFTKAALLFYTLIKSTTLRSVNYRYNKGAIESCTEYCHTYDQRIQKLTGIFFCTGPGIQIWFWKQLESGSFRTRCYGRNFRHDCDEVVCNWDISL